MSLLDLAPVIPVVVVDDVETAVPMARALVAGGLPVIEVTLRTACGLEAIARIAAEVPGAVIGAGTVRTPADIAASVESGAKFLVSPGTTPALLDALLAAGVPFLPGAATASEVMTLAERGLGELKFFPAEAAGGLPYLKSLAGPLPDVRFCPTGGIRPETARDYLALPNVGCVGGTWLTPADALASGDWGRVEKLAAEAAALR
ncbi:bifunctional 4-hydroxy-2-oxoglutarate aldolase/2-dehydro-3-deoxy-phosphogluconate aldolase [Nonomuraea sp. NPDC049152]|uniref:bifunctional 4-hydroxy-2-oxoglutarate aldolase/2-dehydro-3-deoxy-phosphogluconate aldolase n=1 Tax=Nonomuraea sp. NPDC049152 TaxID=3154350 RepID=UPI0033CFEC0C